MSQNGSAKIAVKKQILVEPILANRRLRVKPKKSSQENAMRKVIEKQLKIGQCDINTIHIDIDCRDEIPQLLLGLQAIYADRGIRKQIFNVLKDIVPKNTDTRNGRPGMDLWKILVLGTLRLNGNFDFDKLQDIANNHKTVREFLGHTVFDFDARYALQTIKDNVALFTPAVLDQINQLVVEAGHRTIGAHRNPKIQYPIIHDPFTIYDNPKIQVFFSCSYGFGESLFQRSKAKFGLDSMILSSIPVNGYHNSIAISREYEYLW